MSTKIHYKSWQATGLDKNGERLSYRIIFPIHIGWHQARREATKAGIVKLERLMPASQRVPPCRDDGQLNKPATVRKTIL